MKTQKIIISTLAILVALFVGLYIGSNRNLTVTDSGTNSIPADIAAEADFTDFWEAWRLIEERHPDGTEVTSDEKVWAATSGLVDSLGDPYSVFLPPEDTESLNIDLKGEFSGVGMEVGKRDDILTVISPLKDSPAERAGIMAGDKILQIDETVATGLDVDSAVKLIRGKEGTSVKLVVAREGTDGTKEISIVREVIKLPVMESEYLEKDGIFVISFYNFGENSSEEFEKAITKFEESGSKKLLIDLRNNPGGYLSAAVNITSWFLPAGEVIVSEESKIESENKVYKSRGHYLSGDYKVVILVNEGSASASEIMAGALQEHNKATLVGTQTYGKGSVQELIPMGNKTSLKLTIAKWITPKGVSISKQGLKPDVEVKLDLEKLAKDNYDTQLEEAKKILNKK